MKNLNEMTSKELKQLGKENHVKNWWNLSKAALIEALENAEQAQEVEEVVELPKLTQLEYKLMAGILDDCFYDGLDSVLWTEVFLENFAESNKVLRGVLSSLEKKDLLHLNSTRESSNGGDCSDSTLWLTNLGKTWITKFENGEVEEVKEVKEEKPKRKGKNYIEYNGKSQLIGEWAKELGIKRTTLYNRIYNKGMTMEEAVNKQKASK